MTIGAVLGIVAAVVIVAMVIWAAGDYDEEV